MSELFSNLLTAVEETERSDSILKDDPNFLKESVRNENGLVHTGLTDSSDDEDNRDFQQSKYNEFGKAVKHQLETNLSSSSVSSQSSTSSNWLSKPKHPVSDNRQLQLPEAKKPAVDVYTDPVFGIRIINPLVSSTALKIRMEGRMAISLLKLRKFVENIPASTDWVVAGVIVHKTVRTSQKGNPFSIWTLSDLHGDLKTFALFLFRSAYKDLWKCSLGTVVGVLNASIFEKKQGCKDEACLSVDNVQKVMIIGESKDFGTCRSVKKDGSACTSFVNLNRCEYCVYHVRQEYQKCSKRSELQSAFTGRGLNALRNKVLGKNEVFYAGKSFTAIPATKSRKLQAKDRGRIDMLSGNGPKGSNPYTTREPAGASTNAAKKRAAAAIQHVEVSASRRLKDLELLNKLGGGNKGSGSNMTGKHDGRSTKGNAMFASTEVSLQESKSTALSVIAKLKAKKEEKLSAETEKSEIPFQNDVLEEDKLSDIDCGLSDGESDEKLSTKSEENTPNVPREIPTAAQAENEVKRLKTSLKPSISASTANAPISQKPSTQPTSTQPSKNLLVSKLGTVTNVPILSGIGNKMIDLNSPITQKHVNRANLNALKWVQQNGPIQKENPNKSTPNGGKKRVLKVLEQQDPKRRKIQESDHFSERFKQMMAATSQHTDLLEQRDNDEVEKYFNKLEMKEKMEEKMMSTYKVDCKAVKCLQCKYTSFSAADRCKQERHPLKVFDAVKRFFKCGDCGNRTVSLNVIPTQSCKNCGSGKWERAGMMKEKIVVPKSQLSIRGGEQEHVNSNITNANINLLVPDD